MPPTFWVEIVIVGDMGCFRGKTGGEIKLAKVGRMLLVEVNSQGVRKEWGEGWGRKDKKEICLLSRGQDASSC